MLTEPDTTPADKLWQALRMQSVAEIKLDIESELPKAIAWTNEHTKQLPFSISQAINGTARGDRMAARRQRSVIAAAESSVKNTLDRPRSTTVKSFRVGQTATKRNLQAIIVPKDRGYKRNPYIVGNIRGGERPAKGYEYKFIGKAAGRPFGSGTRLVPGPGLRTDRYGNVSKARLAGMLEDFSTNYASGGTLFSGIPKGVVDGKRRPAGVYRRHNRNKRLTALFIDAGATDYSRPLYRLTDDMQRQTKLVFGPLLRYYIERNVQREIARGRADLRTGLII